MENTFFVTLSRKNVLLTFDFVIGMCLRSSKRCIASMLVAIKCRELWTEVMQVFFYMPQVGDLPDAEVKPPENVLFVCKLNPVTTDEDLEIIFSRFGPIKR